MPQWKKITLIIVFVALIIIFGYLIYTTFFKPIVAPTPLVNVPVTNAPGLPGAAEVLPGAEEITEKPEGGAAPEGALPEAALPERVSAVARGGVTAVTSLTSTKIFSPELDILGESLVYYNKSDGKFYRIYPDGRNEALSNKTFLNVKNISWSPAREQTVLEYPDGSNIVYDFKTNKQATLPKHWEDFEFSPSGDSIASKSIGVDAENRWLVVSATDGTGAKAIQNLGDRADEVIMDWSPNRKMVAMFTNGNTKDRQKLYFIGQNNENFKLLVLPGYGFEGEWSPSGNQMAFSVYSTESNFEPELWITDVSTDNTGSERRSLNVKTWADKCSFAGEDTLYCAVPKNLERGYGFFDEYKMQGHDDFYKINVKTGVKTFIAEPYGENHAVEKLFISADEKYLYFTDYGSGKLYKIQLEE